MKRERIRILIAVKTYPVLSRGHMELVCTAGFREDGTWIRIYPAPFRLLAEDKQYKKYQWIELEVERNPKDKRPESYRPTNIDDIVLGEQISTERGWEARRRLILDNNRVYTNLAEIIRGAKGNEYSLAIFKPEKILDFKAEETDRDWDIDKKAAVEEALNQGSLFSQSDGQGFHVAKKLPYKFSYHFVDDAGKKSNLMIEDWEIGQLYWNCLKSENGDEAAAIEKVRTQYFDNFVKTKDLHLFLGTTKEWHDRARNPYLIIGTFYPPPIKQDSLF